MRSLVSDKENLLISHRDEEKHNGLKASKGDKCDSAERTPHAGGDGEVLAGWPSSLSPPVTPMGGRHPILQAWGCVASYRDVG